MLGAIQYMIYMAGAPVTCLNRNVSAQTYLAQGLWIREHGPVFTGSNWLFPTRH